MSPACSITELVERLTDRPGRFLLGLAGAPGVGKSWLAERLVAALNEAGTEAVNVGMDGFHLADVSLERLGLRHRKGAPETFDAAGYLALLRRLRHEPGTVYAPCFDRELEQPLAAGIAVPPSTKVIITEGNYLLFDGAWRTVRDLLDEIWFLDGEDERRRERLRARHVRFGKSPAAAAHWVDEVDEPNAVAIAATRPRADLVIDLG